MNLIATDTSFAGFCKERSERKTGSVRRMKTQTILIGHRAAMSAPRAYVVSVAASVPTAVEPGVLPGGLSCGLRRHFRVQSCHSGRHDAVLYGSQDGCRYSGKPTLNTYRVPVKPRNCDKKQGQGPLATRDGGPWRSRQALDDSRNFSGLVPLLRMGYKAPLKPNGPLKK